jgi:hypothetical protein
MRYPRHFNEVEENLEPDRDMIILTAAKQHGIDPWELESMLTVYSPGTPTNWKKIIKKYAKSI